MSEAERTREPFVESILHPSDFSEASHNAFAHALAMALHNKARLVLLHSEALWGREDWSQFPRVRQTLERWHAIPAGIDEDDVFEHLEIDVRKVQVTGTRPLTAIQDYAGKHAIDLIVLTTEGRAGLSRLLHPSLAERVASRTRTMTLIVPGRVKGFVSKDDGRVSLRRLLVPVDRRPDATAAIAAAARAAQSMSVGSVEIYLLHVGKEMPTLVGPDLPGCAWRKMTTTGEPVESIVEIARAHDVDMLVLTTEGHQGVLDALRGSVTERVVRNATCPVLAVPANAS
jgi:nucleotide-binding universal stress UspA family protein